MGIRFVWCCLCFVVYGHFGFEVEEWLCMCVCFVCPGDTWK